MTKSPHPWMEIHQAIANGDEQGAREALDNADERLTGRMRVSAYSAIKRAFPEAQEKVLSPAERRTAENEAGNASPVAASLKRRSEDRRQRAKRLSQTKKQGGGAFGVNWGKVDEYIKPDPGGFNTALGNDGPSRAGEGRTKVAAAAQSMNTRARKGS